MVRRTKRSKDLVETVLWLSAITVAVVSILFLFMTEHKAFTSRIINPETFGLYGDFVGGAIGTFVTVYLIYLTYKSQKKELKATRQALKGQINDAAFFNMLGSLRDIINVMEGRVSKLTSEDNEEQFTLRGRAYLHELQNVLQKSFYYEHLDGGDMAINPATLKLQYYIHRRTGERSDDGNEIFEKKFLDKLAIDVESTRDEIVEGCKRFFSDNRKDLDHYLRYIRSVLEFIAFDVASESQKNRYLKILKGQLSEDEMVLVFYYSLAIGNEFQSLVDKYAVLEALSSRDALIDEWHHWHFPLTNFIFLSNNQLEMKSKYRQVKGIREF